MKTKYLCFFLVVLFVVSFFYSFLSNKEENVGLDEVKAVYFSYIEFDNYIANKNENDSKNNIKMIIENLKKYGFNRIIVHVRPFSDSIYLSKIFPVSEYVLNDKGNYPNYDVLKYFIEVAHNNGISFDAWVNPYRISNLKDISKFSKDNIFFFFFNNGLAKITDSGVYLNPASDEVQKLIVSGIEEIVKNYDVDGIHFDDYFYPDNEIDNEYYNNYRNSGGKLSLSEYRYQNINNLLKSVYSSIKKINNKILFGIAPEGNINNCYDNSYLDVKTILSNEGYVDYVMPQIYYGFLNQSKPFVDTINEWKNLIKVSSIKMIPALAMYKSGNYDKYALKGSNEWIENSDIIKREIDYLKSNDNYNGFSIFSYNYLFNEKYFNNQNRIEFKNLIESIK